MPQKQQRRRCRRCCPQQALCTQACDRLPRALLRLLAPPLQRLARQGRGRLQQQLLVDTLPLQALHLTAH